MVFFQIRENTPPSCLLAVLTIHTYEHHDKQKDTSYPQIHLINLWFSCLIGCNHDSVTISLYSPDVCVADLFLCLVMFVGVLSREQKGKIVFAVILGNSALHRAVLSH